MTYHCVTPGFVGVKENGSLLSGTWKHVAHKSAFDARLLDALICERELLTTRLPVLCKKHCIWK